jgi:hypothetical protein
MRAKKFEEIFAENKKARKFGQNKKRLSGEIPDRRYKM